MNAFLVQCKNVEYSVLEVKGPLLVSCIVCPADEKSILTNIKSEFCLMILDGNAFLITHTHKLLLLSEFSINDSIIKYSWNSDLYEYKIYDRKDKGLGQGKTLTKH